MKLHVLLMVILLCVQVDGRNDNDLGSCHFQNDKCRSSEFNCACESNDVITTRPPECIPRSWVCDGLSDCSNESDEKQCVCSPGKFQCNKCQRNESNCLPIYQCIPNDQVCDGELNCANSRDEYNSHCKDKGFKCDNGRYIPSTKKCDGENSCYDRSDEHECGHYKYRCNSNKMKNKECNREECYTELEQCDGHPQCKDHSDELNCTTSCRKYGSLRCACNQDYNYTCKVPGSICYEDRDKCNGYPDCSDHTDERNCSTCGHSYYGSIPCACNQADNYTCNDARQICYQENEKCDGYPQCKDHSDEKDCLSSCRKHGSIRCVCNQVDNYTCKGVQQTCYRENERCDGQSACSDSSDELNCTCPDDLFTCACFSKSKPTCNMKKGCISKQLVNDGKFECDSGNDEGAKMLNNVQCGSCSVNILRLGNEMLCRSPGCDNTTCYNVPALECSTYKCNHTDVICTSNCTKYNTTHDCNTVMQCDDQTTILNYEFCNGRSDCSDKSDEVTNLPGFKCSAKSSAIKCVLPQWNLYDNIAHCYDRSDICFSEDGSLLCFQCLDKHLIISSQQVCDGVIDCYDLSDECLCESTTLPICLNVLSQTDPARLECDKKPWICGHGNASVTLDAVCDGISECNNSVDEASCSKNSSTIKCESKWGNTYAKLCDGRPECKDFKDECHSSCKNPPAFCNDSCHSFYPIGDRYCDGYIDEAWKQLNKTECPRGFDERDCPMRFPCIAGNKVSIDVLQKCNGIIDCDDESDEKDCTDRFYCDAKAGGLISISIDLYLDGKQDCFDGSDEFKSGLFSSPKEMIENPGLLVWFWIVAIITLLGNVYVICMSLKQLVDKNIERIAEMNHLLALNLSASDFLMGVYLFIIVIKAHIYSGSYSMYDSRWRTSSLCSLAGSICVISSQTSSFMMSLFAAHRLFCIFWPFKARGASTTAWKLAIIFAWLTSILLVILSNVLDYFKHAVWFPNPFSYSDTATKDYVTSFACYLASLTNTSIAKSGNAWKTVNSFLSNEFPQYLPQGDIGYYGSTSMCIPQYYVTTSDRYWIYSITMVTLNFISFLFVAISYIFMWKLLPNRLINSHKAQKEEKAFQNRITRLIVTNFCCWIPICIMAYLNIADVTMPDEIDLFTAGVLLPFNSALNPLLYSKHIADLFSRFVKKMQCKKEAENIDQIHHRRHPSIVLPLSPHVDVAAPSSTAILPNQQFEIQVHHRRHSSISSPLSPHVDVAAASSTAILPNQQTEIQVHHRRHSSISSPLSPHVDVAAPSSTAILPNQQIEIQVHHRRHSSISSPLSPHVDVAAPSSTAILPNQQTEIQVHHRRHSSISSPLSPHVDVAAASSTAILPNQQTEIQVHHRRHSLTFSPFSPHVDVADSSFEEIEMQILL